MPLHLAELEIHEGYIQLEYPSFFRNMLLGLVNLHGQGDDRLRGLRMLEATQQILEENALRHWLVGLPNWL